MFEDLKQHITKQNLHQIRKDNRYANSQSHKVSHYEEQSDQDSQSLDNLDSSDSADNLDNFEFQERQQQYKQIINQEQPDLANFKIQYDQHFMTPQCKNKTLTREVELLNEKIKIIQEHHLLELQLANENHQRQIVALQIQLSNKDFYLKKYIKEENLIIHLRKENRALIQLKQSTEDALQHKQHEVTLLKEEMYKLKHHMKELSERQSEKQVKMHLESINEQTLKEQIQHLEREKIVESQRKRHGENNSLKLKRQNEELHKVIGQLERQLQQDKQELSQTYQETITKLEAENKDIKRRNSILEESLIDHLTQTSQMIFNHNQSMQNQPFKHRATTFNDHFNYKNISKHDLDQESPIKSDRKPTKYQDKSSLELDQDPENYDHNKFLGNRPNKSKEQCQVCACKMTRLSDKLKQANEKIVELLRWKCEQVRRKGYY